MGVLRYAFGIIAVLLVLGAALLGGYFIMGPLMQSASGPGASVGSETQDALTSQAGLQPTGEASPTPFSSPDLLPTRVPSHTPEVGVGQLPTRAPTSTAPATLEPTLSALTPTQPPLPVPTQTEVPTTLAMVTRTGVVPSPEVSVTAAVVKVAGIVVLPASLAVTEPEGSETFVITLSSEPEGAVSIPLSVASDECLVTPSEVTLDSANWSSGVSVSVAAIDDDVADGDQVCVVGTGEASSSGADYAGMAVEDVTVTVADDETVAIVVMPASLTVSEPEGSETFVISLSSEPDGTVSIPLSVASDECSVTPGEVALDAANWRSGVSVVVAAVDDKVVDGDQVCVVETGPASSGGADYGGLAVEDVAITVVDDDAAGVVVAPASLTVSEPEGSKTFVIALSSEPEGAVGIALSVASDECSVTPAEVTLDSTNWRSGVTVAVAAVDDKVADGDQVCVIGTGEASSSSADYAGMAVEDVAVTVADDEAAGILVVPVSLTAREPEGSETFLITLRTEPEEAVSIPFSVASDECSVTPGEVTLDAANWRSGVSVAVAVVDDEAADGDQVCLVETGAASSGGADYAGMAVEDVAVTVVDDETAGIVVAPASLTASEPEGSESFVIALSSEPEAAVSITLSVASDECSVTPGEVTLNGANWRSGVSVAVAVVDDEVEDGEQVCVVETGSASSSGADYADLAVEDVAVTVEDDDSARIVVAPTNLAVNEPEGSGTYAISLGSEPTDAVVVSIAGDAQTAVSPESLTFTNLNWNVEQSVVVTAVDDDVAEGPHSGIISHAVSSSDASYDGAALGDVTVSVTDDDAMGVIVAPGEVLVDEGGAPQGYAVVLASQPTSSVTVKVVPDGQTTVHPEELTFPKLEWNVPQAVTVTAVDDDVAEGLHISTIGHVASSDDDSYNDIPVDDVIAPVTDNEAEDVIATPAQVVAEAGQPGDSSPSDTGGRLEISPAIVLVVVLAIVASLIELRSARRRGSRG